MSALPDLVYGDWEWDEAADRPGALYPARIVSRWSGGVEFLTDRATAERIVAAQIATRAALMNPEDVDALAWDGDVIVYTGVDGSVYRYEAGIGDGLYHCGFGWTWSQWTEEVPSSSARERCAVCGGDLDDHWVGSCPDVSVTVTAEVALALLEVVGTEHADDLPAAARAAIVEIASNGPELYLGRGEES
jgi:hypothetical protein